MPLVMKAALICIVSASFAVALKKTVPDIAFGVQLVGTIVVILLAFEVLSPIYSFLREAAALLGSSGMYVTPVLKAALIGVLSCVGSALCKDAGQSALSVSLEVLGAAAAVYTALPLLELFVHTIGEML